MRAMNRSAFALRETSRRLLSLGVVSLALASPWALAREGVDVNKQHSGFARLVPGRGELISRSRPPEMVQIAVSGDGDDE